MMNTEAILREQVKELEKLIEMIKAVIEMQKTKPQPQSASIVVQNPNEMGHVNGSFHSYITLT